MNGVGSLPAAPGTAKGRLDRGLVSLTLIVLVIKVIVFIFFLHFNEDAFYTPDSKSYITRAVDMITYGTFSLRGEPDIFRTPGYPLLLVPFIVIFGTEKVHYVLLFQFILVAATAYFVYKIVLLLFETNAGKKMARIAFVIVMADPATFISELSVMADSFLVFTVMSGLYYLIKYVRFDKWSDVLMGFAILGLSAYIKPVALYLPYLCGLILLLYKIKHRRFAGVILVLIAFLASYFITDCWQQRNKNIFGVKIFTSISAAGIYHYFAAAVTATAEGKSYKEMQKRYEDDLVSRNPAIQAKHNMKKGLKIILSHPLISARIGLKALLVNMFEPGTGMLANNLGLRKAQSNIIYRFHDMKTVDFLLYILTNETYLILFIVLGEIWLLLFWFMFYRGIKSKSFHPDACTAILLGALLYSLVVPTLTGPGVIFRFRVPTVPLMAIFAAVGIVLSKPSWRFFNLLRSTRTT